MSKKDLLFCMLVFIKRNKHLSCKDLRVAFANAYGMTEKDASDMICKISSLMLFAETFNINTNDLLTK